MGAPRWPLGLLLLLAACQAPRAAAKAALGAFVPVGPTGDCVLTTPP